MECTECLVTVEISATRGSTLVCYRTYMVKFMVLKLTGGSRLGRLSKPPIRSGVDEGFGIYASSATSNKEGSLA